jgi:cytochrome b561
MNWRNTDERFGSLSIALHWSMLVLLLVVVAFMELREIFPKGSVPREAMKSLHYLLGMLVLPLALVRMAARLPGTVPSAPAGWQRSLAALVKFGLYALMLGMPVAGWLLLSAKGDSLAVLGWNLPPLVGPNETLAEYMEEIHESGAALAYVLLGLHVLGALYHHFVLRDNTLRRILP